RADNTLALGIVPFSHVVNVGTDATQQEWVKNWRNQIAAGIPAARTAHLPADYVSTAWSGCIAEPQPWTAPAQRGQGLAPLTPSAGFIPLFARVNTSFYWNANAGKASTDDMGDGWELFRTGSERIITPPAGEKHPKNIVPQWSHQAQLLWATDYEFKAGGNPHRSLHVF